MNAELPRCSICGAPVLSRVVCGPSDARLTPCGHRAAAIPAASERNDSSDNATSGAEDSFRRIDEDSANSGGSQ